MDSLLPTTQCNMDSKELESPELDSKRFINRKCSCLVGIVSVVLTGAAIAAVITVFIETSPRSWSETYVWAGTKMVAESEEIGSYVDKDHTSHDVPSFQVPSLVKTNKVAPG